MSKVIAFLLASLFHTSVSAQDLSLSFSGIPLRKQNDTYYVTKEMLLKNGRLISETRDFSITSYQIAFLSKGGPILGPYTITNQALPDSIKRFIEDTNTDLKILLADIVLASNFGTGHSKNYVIEITEPTDIMVGEINLHRAKSINIDDLISHGKLKTFDTTLKIVSYEMLLLNSGPTSKLLGPVKINGAELNDEALRMLKDNANCSGKVFIDEIRCLDYNGKLRYPSSCIINYHK